VGARTPGQQSFDVATNAQTITFTGPGDVELSASPVTVSATATATLAVVFTSDTTAVCTVSGDQVSLLAAGTCTINADQPGDATWAPAPQVTRSFEVVVPCSDGGGAAGTCVVGDTGPGGGKVFYVNPISTPGSNYMEAAPNTWNGGLADPTIPWCSNTSTLISGTFGTAIGDGAANTDNMVANGACVSGAANSVRAYTGGLGVGTWSLPSKDELNELYINRASVGGFTAGEYWSSSQTEVIYAWVRNFSTSASYLNTKGNTFYVRPVRAF